MKKTLFILFTAISLHGFSQSSPYTLDVQPVDVERMKQDSAIGAQKWYSMLRGDTVWVKTTKAYFKAITTNPQVAKELMDKYPTSIKYVNIAYKGMERKYTIYLPLAMKEEASLFIENINPKP